MNTNYDYLINTLKYLEDQFERVNSIICNHSNGYTRRLDPIEIAELEYTRISLQEQIDRLRHTIFEYDNQYPTGDLMSPACLQ